MPYYTILLNCTFASDALRTPRQLLTTSTSTSTPSILSYLHLLSSVFSVFSLFCFFSPFYLLLLLFLSVSLYLSLSLAPRPWPFADTNHPLDPLPFEPLAISRPASPSPTYGQPKGLLPVPSSGLSFHRLYHRHLGRHQQQHGSRLSRSQLFCFYGYCLVCSEVLIPSVSLFFILLTPCMSLPSPLSAAQVVSPEP